MSEQSGGRAVGAASLIIKCLFLFGVLVAVVIAVSLWLHWRVTERAVYEQNRIRAAGLVDQLMLKVHWEGLDTPDEPWKKMKDELTEQLAGTLGENRVEATFLYRPDAPGYPASGSGRAANQFETDLIAQFMPPRVEGEKKPAAMEASPPDGDRFDYYQPIYTERECIGTCHITPPPAGVFEAGVDATNVLAVGDLMAVAKISLPNDELREALTATWYRLLAIAIVTALLVMVAFYLVMRYVMARLAR